MNDRAGRATLLERMKDVASLVRDIGVIVGVPTVITVGIRLYDIQSKSLEQQIKANEAQIKALESENDALKQTQYDRALTHLKSQREIYEMELSKMEAEKSDMEKQMNVLRLSGQKAVDDLSYKMAVLEIQLRETEKNIQLSGSIISKIDESVDIADIVGLSFLTDSTDVQAITADLQATTTKIEELLRKATLTAAESQALKGLMRHRADLSEDLGKTLSAEDEKRKQVIKDIKR